MGGLVAAVAAGLLLAALVGAADLPAAQLAGVSAAIGLLAQFGDLVDSAYKRIAGVKDSGLDFPGHGGLLDRTS